MRNILPLLIANSLSLAALMAIIPVIGPVIRELGLQEWHGGAVVSIAGILWMLTARRWGHACDHYGRKRIIVLGLTGFIVCYFAMCMYLEYALVAGGTVWFIVLCLMLTRGLIGGFFSAIPTSTAAKIIDISPTNLRGANMSKLGAANAVGLVLGPSLAGVLAVYGLITPLWVAGALPLLALIWILVKLPSDKPHEPTPAPIMRILDPRIRLSVIASVIVFYAIITFQACVSFYAIDVLQQSNEAAAQSAGYSMTLVGITLIIVQGTAMRFHNVHSLSWMLWGTVVSIAGMSLFVFMQNHWGFYLGSIIVPAGFGLVIPAFQTLAANSVSDKEQGAAAGSISAAQALAAVVAPLSSTAIYQINHSVPYAISALLLVVLLFLTLRAWVMRDIADGAVSD